MMNMRIGRLFHKKLQKNTRKIFVLKLIDRQSKTSNITYFSIFFKKSTFLIGFLSTFVKIWMKAFI
jgi:hypothetical protein